jgi:arginyl-tRNA synthetase
MNLLKYLQSTLRQALEGLSPQPDVHAAMLKPAGDARYGDYQANCAMALSKIVGKPPLEIAQTIADRLKSDPALTPPEVAKPGFVNLRLKPEWLAQQVQAMAADERLGVEKATPPKTFVIDYSSPNVAKPMHVGHLRSTIIGDALARLLRFLGHTVVADNHLGDWGTQFGILLYGYKNYLNKEAFAADPVRELARLYLHVRSLFRTASEDAEDAADPVQEACRLETAKLHAGDPENRRLWQMFMPFCYKEIEHIYQRLDVHFDHTHGESFYDPMLPGVVQSLVEKGLAQESQGAVIIPAENENEPPALIRKRDGAFTYTTSDLATIQYRLEQWHPNHILYVVDFRQQQHFKSLFTAAKKWGCNVDLEHISFGAVVGKDRRPFKTRSGGVPELNELLDEAVQKAAEVYAAAAEKGEGEDLNSDQLKPVYEAVGYGAVKYADLSQNRTSDYIFDWNKMMAMDGNTATYMQYAYARNRSIFRKGDVDPASLRKDPPGPIIGTDHERGLALQLARFNDALLSAAEDYRPSQVTSYLWDLCKSYSGFFQNCPVLKAETPELRRSRLLLCDVTARVIQKALDLLGIRTLERM